MLLQNLFTLCRLYMWLYSRYLYSKKKKIVDVKLGLKLISLSCLTTGEVKEQK